MPEFGYSFKEYDPLIHVRASRREVDVSPKAATEVCAFIKGKKLPEAKRLLEEVIAKKRVVPFRKYKRDLGHKSGLEKFYAGRYPVKAAKEVLAALENLESNAEFKGFDTDNLVIIHAAAHRGRKVKSYIPRAFGRSSPSFNTLTHIEVVGKVI